MSLNQWVKVALRSRLARSHLVVGYRIQREWAILKATSHSDKDLSVERIGHGQIPRCVAMDCHLTVLA